VPEIGLPPDLVLLIFLPPLLYSAAFFSSPRDLRANLRPIASLSIGLVLLTTLTVAAAAHLVVGLPWAAALLQLRSEGRISDEVRRRVERDLDLEDARLEI
jgi:CPA1 family monovalent cation:H+ antiporter